MVASNAKTPSGVVPSPSCRRDPGVQPLRPTRAAIGAHARIRRPPPFSIARGVAWLDDAPVDFTITTARVRGPRSPPGSDDAWTDVTAGATAPKARAGPGAGTPANRAT